MRAHHHRRHGTIFLHGCPFWLPFLSNRTPKLMCKKELQLPNQETPTARMQMGVGPLWASSACPVRAGAPSRCKCQPRVFCAQSSRHVSFYRIQSRYGHFLLQQHRPAANGRKQTVRFNMADGYNKNNKLKHTLTHTHTHTRTRTHTAADKCGGTGSVLFLAKRWR